MERLSLLRERGPVRAFGVELDQLAGQGLVIDWLIGRSERITLCRRPRLRTIHSRSTVTIRAPTLVLLGDATSAPNVVCRMRPAHTEAASGPTPRITSCPAHADPALPAPATPARSLSDEAVQVVLGR